MASDAVALRVAPIRLRIRELPCVRQDDLAVGNGLGEKAPPSFGVTNASVITCRETVLPQRLQVMIWSLLGLFWLKRELLSQTALGSGLHLGT